MKKEKTTGVSKKPAGICVHHFPLKRWYPASTSILHDFIWLCRVVTAICLPAKANLKEADCRGCKKDLTFILFKSSRMKHLLLPAAGKSRLHGFSSLIFVFFLCFAWMPGTVLQAQKKSPAKSEREYIVLKVYHAVSTHQLSAIDEYLQASFLPTLEKSGFRRIGVFAAISNDTAADKKMYVLIPLNGLSKLEQLNRLTQQMATDTVVAKAYTKAAHNQPSFDRLETILLQSFAGMPQVKAPALKGAREERVYELRSYEAASEALHLNKVKMFNEGEVQLFDRLGFNAVFYGQVMAGCRMPNLMYMTSFENKAARDEHWKSFGNDPEWKTMSAMPVYQNNVSKIDITFLRPTTYSKL